MKNSLRMFIRESLMREAVGRDLFGLQSVDYMDVKKEKFEDSATDSIMKAGGTFFQAGKAFVTSPKGGKIKAASSVMKNTGWSTKATGSAYIFAILVSSFGTNAGKDDGEKDQFADTKIEEFHKELIEVFRGEAGSKFSKSLRYEPVVNDQAAANFYERSKIKPFREHYETKIPGAISASTDYNTFFGQFSNLTGTTSAAVSTLKTGVEDAVASFVKEQSGKLASAADQAKLEKALKQWAYYELIFITTHEFMSSAISSDIDTISKNTTDDSSKRTFQLEAEEMINAAKSKIENNSTYKKAKSQLNDAGYYEY